MSTACAEELQLLIRSGWNLIALESSEEDRALGLLRRIAQHRAVHVHRVFFGDREARGRGPACGLPLGAGM